MKEAAKKLQLVSDNRAERMKARAVAVVERVVTSRRSLSMSALAKASPTSPVKDFLRPSLEQYRAQGALITLRSTNQ